MSHLLIPLLLVLASATDPAHAHSWKRGAVDGAGPVVFDEALRAHILAEWQQEQGAESVAVGQKPGSTPQVAANGATPNVGKAPTQAAPFVAFAPQVNVRWDKDALYVESNGMPTHAMMVGITNWQQQVPLPQAYVGDNAWRIPLHPVPAKTPAMVKGRFLRGAIALGVNGIPIFNPQNNRGEVSAEIGELDQWGGHCGRADDYHYHAAPLHLQAQAGKGMPIAYALDGYPIYGLTEPDGSALRPLDECQGHEDAKVGYHYHASTKRPYLQAGFHGEVTEVGGQVDPQPRAQGVRPDTAPLRGAEITAFKSVGTNGYQLSYTLSGEKREIRYTLGDGGSYAFEFDNGREGTVKQVYSRRSSGGDGPGPGGPGRRPGGSEPNQERRGEVSTLREKTDGPVSRPAKNPMDLNADGLVSAQEFADSAKRHAGDKPLAEVMEKARSAFQSLDANQDGKLESGELQSSASGGEAASSSANGRSSFSLTSPEVADGGALPVEFTGDGSGSTLPLEWKGAPAGTQSYALIMDHLDPENVTKSYWVVWDIPASLNGLTKNAKNVGRQGVGFRGEVGYEAPHSKGPGAKTYVLHVYALSAAPKLSQQPSSVTREVLLAAMQDRILASADLHVVYTRGEANSSTSSGTGSGNGGNKGGPPPAMRKGAEEREPQPQQGGLRKPWMQMHATELDTDKDGIVTLAEMNADMQRAIGKYDGDKDGVVTPAEIDAAGDVREGAAFAGFIYRHAVDVDANNDSRLPREELMAAAKYIFDTVDADHDGKVTQAEVQSSPPASFPMGSKGGGPSPAPSAKMESTTDSSPSEKPPNAGGRGGPDKQGLKKPGMAETVKLNVYADNWFMLYINGKLTAVDSIDFLPHNVVSVDVLPEYPMTIAILAKDNADPKTGMEYGDHIGDGGFILKFSDGTVTNATWKAKSFFKGPLNHETHQPKVEHTPLQTDWYAVDFDDHGWANATEYTQERVNPKEAFFNADFDGAKFIWTEDLDLDNTVLFRTKIDKPGWVKRWNTVPDLDVRGAPQR